MGSAGHSSETRTINACSPLDGTLMLPSSGNRRSGRCSEKACSVGEGDPCLQDRGWEGVNKESDRLEDLEHTALDYITTVFLNFDYTPETLGKL